MGLSELDTYISVRLVRHNGVWLLEGEHPQQDLHRVGKPVSHDCSCRFPLPEEQSVHQLSGPCPHPVPRPTVTARGQGFVRPAAEERIDELVNGDQRSFSVGHAASTSSGVVAASTAALRSPPRCIVPFLCRMAPPA